MSRTFLLLFNELPIDRTSVKRGKNHPSVVTAARSINVALFLSNDMRRDVTVSLGIVGKGAWYIVAFPGNSLRRVSPDERSITFFLLKAFGEMEQIDEQGSFRMDNGIVVEKVIPEEYLSRWSGNIFKASIDGELIEASTQKVDILYIYEVDIVKEIDEIDVTYIQKPRTPERFILDINMIYDKTE